MRGTFGLPEGYFWATGGVLLGAGGVLFMGWRPDPGIPLEPWKSSEKRFFSPPRAEKSVWRRKKRAEGYFSGSGAEKVRIRGEKVHLDPAFL
jgi:hypothetical protein